LSQGNPYAVTKLAHHPEQLAAFREGKTTAPVQIHLMWQNLCQADCSFCSYRLSNWKNSQQFNDRESIPWELLQETLRHAREMGTKAIELTGGGEPTIYPKYEQGIDLIHDLGFDLGIVTNGVALTAARCVQLGSVRGWKWARVSIDAGTVKTYCDVRRVPPNQWDRAWAAVRNLAAERDRRGDPEIRVGCGFVVTRENFAEVFEFCRLAKKYGADNVRLSVRFGPGGNDYYDAGMLDTAELGAAEAVTTLQDETFTVHDLISERRANQASSVQDYEPCYTMRLLCVIGGDSKVYSCCTLAFSPAGELGDLRKESFRTLWERHARANFDWFKVHERCAVQCLYEKRNLAMIDMVDGKSDAIADPNQPHRNFV
jgi:MoaA/NifB/PqqE/SkfB family radical SAM enzyme